MIDDLPDDPETTRLDILKGIPPLLPQFLKKRRVGLPAVGELMRELGVERAQLFMLVHLDELQGSYGGPVTLAQIRADNPYTVIDYDTPLLAALLDKGLVERDGDGAFSMSERARQVVERLHEAGREYVGR